MRAPLLVFLLLAVPLGGCTLSEPQAPTTPADPTRDPDEQMAIQAGFAMLRGTPGHVVELPVVLGCDEPSISGPYHARVVADDLTGSDVSVECGRVSFLPLELPDGTQPGARDVAVEVRAGDDTLLHRTREAARLEVLARGKGWDENQTAVIAYTTRFTDTSEVVYSNEPQLASFPIARNESFRQGSGPLLVRNGTLAGLPAAFVVALEGMQAGEHRTIRLSPEEAYGNATLLTREPRDETLPRDELIEVEHEAMSWDTFADHIRRSGQGDPEAFDEGDHFVIEQGGNAWRYVIEERTASRVDYRLDLELGSRLTLYPFWPHATEVVAVTEDHVALYTTPTMDAGEPFTMRSGWPDMTAITRVDEATITLRHSPPVGLEYPRAGGTARIVEVTEDHVVRATQNPHALAGRPITFSIHVVELRD